MLGSICCDRRSSSQVPDPKWPDLSRFGVHPFHHVSVQSSEMLKCFMYKFPGPILSGPIVDIYQPPANPAGLSWAWDASSKQPKAAATAAATTAPFYSPSARAWREAPPKATATAATTATPGSQQPTARSQQPTANSQQEQQHRRGPSGNRAQDLLDMGWFWWSWCLCLCLWLGWGVAGGVFRRCKNAHHRHYQLQIELPKQKQSTDKQFTVKTPFTRHDTPARPADSK